MLLGDLVSWIYQDLGGINSDPDNLGYKHIILKPDFSVDEIDDISTSYKSIYGNIQSKWKKKNGMLHWQVEIPANTTATLHMPDGTTRETGSGKYSFTEKLPMRDSSIVTDEFLYTKATFPECHSATIAETTKGDLVATYFGGTKERNPDVCIWVSRKVKGSKEWTKPQMVADGIRAAGIGSGSRPQTVILQVGRRELGRVVYELNKEETQRVGVQLASVKA